MVGYADLKKAPWSSSSPVGEPWAVSPGGLEDFLDGSPPGSHSLDAGAPIQGGDGTYTGYPIYSDEEVTGFVRRSLRLGRSLAHCNGDAAAAQYPLLPQGAGGAGRAVRDIRPVMIHSQLVRLEQLAEMKELGILPPFCRPPVVGGDIHVENFGARRAASISPGAAERLGLSYTLHQGTPSSSRICSKGVWCAVNRVTRRSRAGAGIPRLPLRSPPGRDGKRRLPVPAWRGRRALPPGKAADLVLLDRDPTAVPPEDIRGIRVLETIKNGVQVFQA